MGFTYTHIQQIDKDEFDALLDATNFVNQIYTRGGVAVAIESKEPFKVAILYNDLHGFFALATFFGQYVERSRLLWKFAAIEKEKKKSWHEVKKGMEKHEHKFTIPITHHYNGKAYSFLQCEHEGCYVCYDPTI